MLLLIYYSTEIIFVPAIISCKLRRYLSKAGNIKPMQNKAVDNQIAKYLKTACKGRNQPDVAESTNFNFHVFIANV